MYLTMQAVADHVFKALADPTRRAIFEHLARDGEQTVHALTGRAGVSQPAVSKHLGVLKHARLVRCRRNGRETHYNAQPQARLEQDVYLVERNSTRADHQSAATVEFEKDR